MMMLRDKEKNEMVEMKYTDPVTKEMRTKKSVVTEFRELIVNCIKRAEEELAIEIAEEENRRGYEIKKYVIPELEFLLEMIDGGYELQEQWSRYICSYWNAWHEWDMDWNLTSILEKVNKMYETIPVDDFRIRDSEEKVAEMSDARRYEIERKKVDRQNEEENCLHEIENCIYRAKKEMDNRERGIPGEATPKQLEYIIAEMELLLDDVKTHSLRWSMKHSKFESLAKAENEWQWKSDYMTSSLHIMLESINYYLGRSNRETTFTEKDPEERSYRDLETNEMRTKESAVMEFREVIVRCMNSAENEMARMIDEGNHGDGFEIKNKLIPEMKLMLKMIDEGYELQEQDERHLYSRYGAWGIWRTSSELLSLLQEIDLIYKTIPIDDFAIRNSEEKLPEKSKAKIYRIEREKMEIRTHRGIALFEMEECIDRAKKELDNRERGIPGEATPEQLGYIINEMESLYRSVKTHLFTWKNYLKRFTCYDKAKNEWNWQTIQMTTLYTQFEEMRDKYRFFELVRIRNIPKALKEGIKDREEDDRE